MLKDSKTNSETNVDHVERAARTAAAALMQERGREGPCVICKTISDGVAVYAPSDLGMERMGLVPREDRVFVVAYYTCAEHAQEHYAHAREVALIEAYKLERSDLH
jgi:hypothetical protein